MSSFGDAFMVDENDTLSAISFADSSVYDSGADTDTDISVVSSMSTKRRPVLKNEQYLFDEIKAVSSCIFNLLTFSGKSVLTIEVKIETRNYIVMCSCKPDQT